MDKPSAIEVGQYWEYRKCKIPFEIYKVLSITPGPKGKLYDLIKVEIIKSKKDFYNDRAVGTIINIYSTTFDMFSYLGETYKYKNCEKCKNKF